MRLVRLALLLTVLATSYAYSQTANGSQEKCSVQGTVIDSKTGQPLRGADVVLGGTSGSWPAETDRTDSSSTTSDSEGRFSFDGVGPGRYGLRASKNGYLGPARRLGGARPSAISLSAGQHLDGITLRLTPSAVIAGRVTTEGEEPIPNVAVEAMKFSYQGDKRQLANAGNGTTNDRGEYRIWGLPPGKYYVRATHPRGMVSRTGGQVYVPIFYPGVSDLSRTQALEVHPGDELTGIDLNFVSLHSVRVSGHVLNANSSPAKDARVTLVGGSGNTVYTVNQASTDPKGAFEIRGVPPGSYVLIGEQFGNGDQDKTMRGRTSLEVGDTNVSDVEVAVGPGSAVSGHVRLEGKTSTDLSKLTVALDPQDDMSSLGFGPDVGNVPVRADGTFAFHDVPEGTYHLKVQPLPDGYYQKPSGEGDAAEADVKVGRNHGAAVELVLSAGAGRVAGTVNKGDQPFAGATVVLVPDAPRRGQPRFYRQAISDTGGRFNISSITPGDYKLFAWEEIDHGMYLDPDFLQSYEDSGQSVKVEEGGNLNPQLELIPANEAQ
jgi:protocatechuate 3,4-dioxygenase beta subunit